MAKKFEPDVAFIVDTRELRSRLQAVGDEFALTVGDDNMIMIIEQGAGRFSTEAVDALKSLRADVDQFLDLIEARAEGVRRRASGNVLQFPDLGGATPAR
ncbi:hypothetical protein OHA72_20870 [Dactylosporangium sp. NBC_01737]|uniref:hypothetical protein n=1 Tax=Dactylosporangium sp. NBC_01737 TaxID=2975959 RepID=UPI002E0F6C25|nr:hypothetical protein OHA72_20870 [Dactylosporangium sp. NBC_01737]